MKKIISYMLAFCVIASALSLGACSKKHTIETDVELGGNESVSGAAGVIYENVTDEKGENVTDAAGEVVTVAVPAEETASGKEDAATKKGETAQPSDDAAKKGETSDKKNETTTKKGETTTKKGETSDKKNETTTKKSETTTKKGETTTKKNETTTKKGESTSNKTEETTNKPEGSKPSTTEPPKVVINPGDYQFDLRADKTEVSPGDTVTVTLKLKNCKNVACFGIYVKCGARKGLVETEKFKSNRFSDDDGNNFDIYSNNEDREGADVRTVDKGVLFGGMTSTTYSFINDDLCTVTYKVSSNAEKGETLMFSAVPSQFLVCPNESGSTTQDCAGDIEIVPVMVTVK